MAYLITRKPSRRKRCAYSGLRLLAARWYRLRSYFHKCGKTQDIMDVNQQTVIDVMRQHQCQLLIHGHTHRPNRHQFMIDEQEPTRLVLADWKKQSGEVLVGMVENLGLRRFKF
jgi:UDP-2,3-diacylglucosamine hydrolase